MKTDHSLQTRGSNADSSIRAGAFTPPGDQLDGVITELIITSPESGTMLKGPNVTIQVTGTASFGVNGQNRNSDITAVKVRIGASGAFENATLNRSTNPLSWSLTKTGLNGLLPITAQFFTPQSNTTPVEERTIAIQVDSSAPVLTITQPPEVNSSAPPYIVVLQGAVTDALTGVDKIEAQVGGGTFSKANLAGTTWQKSISLPNLGNHPITVKATDKVGNADMKTVNVTVADRTPPNLNIAFPSNGATITLVNGKASVAGTASDSQTGVTLVEWALDNKSQFTPAVPAAANDWSTWSALIPIPTPGEHKVTMRARDGAGNTKASIVTFEAAMTFAPKDLNDVVSPAVHLDDLLNFAALRVKTAAGPLVSRDLLVNTFFQSFNALTAPNNRDAAHQPVHQVRICIEVLRKLNPSVAAEANYLQTAYETLLRNLGTSYEELRLVGAGENKRQALANRLGIAPTPDQLDRLILQPNQITEVNLEKRFGLAQTRDPLSPNAPPVTQEPELLTWQLEKQRALWKQQDDAARSDMGTLVPVIDPDLIGDRDFRTPTPLDGAYLLWQQRRKFVTDELARIKQLRESPQKTAIAGFNEIVNNVLGSVDELITLADQYKQGNDIESQLKAKKLTLQPFLHLLRIRDLASTGTVLDREWTDVYSILAQVQKFRQYDVWRKEEGTLTLGPDYFKLSLAETQPFELPRWRATQQARQSWQAALEARINQKQTLIQALQAAVDATEEVALPLLRDALLETLRQNSDETIRKPYETVLDVIANRLTRELAIDFKVSRNQKTTRIEQGIETMQTILFSVRTGRFADTDRAANWKLALKSDYKEADFDEEWQWMGTYAAWRSAMFVFLRPENLLLPSLRRHQTPVFRNLVSELRSNRRLAPEQARAIAVAYSEYYRDVCSLTLDASCQTGTNFYMFGRGSTTGRVYWSSYDPQDTSDYAQTFWEVVGTRQSGQGCRCRALPDQRYGTVHLSVCPGTRERQTKAVLHPLRFEAVGLG